MFRARLLRRAGIAALFVFATVSSASAQARVDRNVVYGMYSGLALLLDVHYPIRPNGFGVVFIGGSGFSAPVDYSAVPLKESAQVGMYIPSLLEAGYTVFAVNHRATAAFQYPAPLEDVQRAVRFIRHNAVKYGVAANRLGGSGGSSGANLVMMLATLDGAGDPADIDPVNRESAKLQCVTARAAPIDLLRMTPSDSADASALYLGARAAEIVRKGSAAYRKAWAASPINYVSRDDAPTLLFHGDADRTVPFHQSELMETALRTIGVPVRLIRVPGGDHGPTFPGATNSPDYKAEIVKWFDEHLRTEPRHQ